MGLFKPAWKTDAWYKLDKALVAVDKAKPSELKEIALNAYFNEVACRAVDRMDVSELKDVALKVDSEPVFERICDRLCGSPYEDDLGVIAVQNEHTRYRQEAAERITNQEVLANLVRNGDVNDPDQRGMFAGIGGNPNTPADLLDELACCSSPLIRDWVAGNPSTPDEAIARLVFDEEESVRRSVLTNPQLPVETLAVLCGDGAYKVSSRAREQFQQRAEGMSEDELIALFNTERFSPEAARIAWKQLDDLGAQLSDDELMSVALRDPRLIEGDERSTRILAFASDDDLLTIASGAQCKLQRKAVDKLIETLPDERLQELAEDSNCTFRQEACGKIGHVRGKKCVCSRCGLQLSHDVDVETCRHCKGKLKVCKTTEYYDYIDGVEFRTTDYEVERTIIMYPDGTEELVDEKRREVRDYAR